MKRRGSVRGRAGAGMGSGPGVERVITVLIKQDLWGHVTGNVVWPVPADVNMVTAAAQQSIDNWERKDQQAYAAICLQISDKYIIYTYNMTTAKKVWDTLMTIFEASCYVP